MAKRLSRRELEVRRLEASLADELRAYAGSWVAIKDYHVAVASDSPKRVLAALALAGIEGATLDFVPKPGTVYILPAATTA